MIYDPREHDENPAHDKRLDLLKKIDKRLGKLNGKYGDQKEVYYNTIVPILLNVCENGSLAAPLEMILKGLSKKNLNQRPYFIEDLAYALQHPDEVLGNDENMGDMVNMSNPGITFKKIGRKYVPFTLISTKQKDDGKEDNELIEEAGYEMAFMKMEERLAGMI